MFHWRIPLFLNWKSLHKPKVCFTTVCTDDGWKMRKCSPAWTVKQDSLKHKTFFHTDWQDLMFGLVCNIPQYLHPTQRWQPEPGMEPSSPHTDTSHCQMERRLHDMKEICDIVSYSEKVQHVVSGKNISGELHKWFSNFLCPKQPSLYKIASITHVI